LQDAGALRLFQKFRRFIPPENQFGNLCDLVLAETGFLMRLPPAATGDRHLLGWHDVSV
jgi:hypothetical protein